MKQYFIYFLLFLSSILLSLGSKLNILIFLLSLFLFWIVSTIILSTSNVNLNIYFFYLIPGFLFLLLINRNIFSLVLIISLIILSIGLRRYLNDEKELKINFLKISKNSFQYFFNNFILLNSIGIIFLSLLNQNYGPIIFTKILDVLDFIALNYQILPASSMTFKDVIHLFARKFHLDNLIQEEAINSFFNFISAQMGITLNADLSFRDLILVYIKNNHYLTLSSLVVLALLINSLANFVFRFLSYPAALIPFIAFKLLLKLNIITLDIKKVDKEILIIKNGGKLL